MAIQCQYCGTDLPRDDARFCNNCGMLVPSHPFSPQSISAAKINTSQSSTPPQARDEGRPVLREQVAHLPPARPSPLPARNTPSSWHGQYTLSEQGEQEEKGPPATTLAEIQEKLPETPKPEIDEEEVAEEPVQPERLPSPTPQPRPLPNIARVRDQAAKRNSAAPPSRSPVWPTAMTHVSVNEPAEADALPEQPSVANAQQPERELHVRVWEAEEEAPSKSEHADEITQDVEDLPTRAIAALPTEQANSQEQSVDLLPTSALELPRSEPAQARPDEEPPTSPLPQQSSEPTDGSPYGIEYQSTASLPPSKSAPSQAGNTILETPTKNVNIDKRQPSQAGNTMLDAPMQNVNIDKRQPEVVQRAPAPHTPLPMQEPAIAARDDRGQAPVRARRSSRLPLLIGALLLVILIVGGVGVWIASAQPFNVAPITQPQLSFSNAQLGVALSYPNGWTQQVVPGAAHFFASNHTAGVDIIVANAGDVNAALQQQATQLGLSGTKTGAALSFAGTTWQQSQGNLQQSGANYTVTLLAAVHGSHLYTIVQQAPQSNYADWEQAFFAPLRGSLKFL